MSENKSEKTVEIFSLISIFCCLGCLICLSIVGIVYIFVLSASSIWILLLLPLVGFVLWLSLFWLKNVAVNLKLSKNKKKISNKEEDTK